MNDKILEFPKIHLCDKAEDALEMAKGWNFSQVMIVGYVEGHGTPEGTIITSTSPDALKNAKNQLFMAELLRYQALKSTEAYEAAKVEQPGGDDVCRNALKWLVALKAHKDQHGKTPHYEEMQPKAWENATAALRTQPAAKEGGEEQHLTLHEQSAMHRAFKSSGKIVAGPRIKQNPASAGSGAGDE